LPFWPIIVTEAFCGPSQRFALFTSNPFFAAEEVQGETADRHVGGGFEARPEPAVDGVDAAVEFDLDLALEVGDEVGQLVEEERR